MAEHADMNIHASPVAEGVRFQIDSATAFAVRKESKDVALRLRREFHPVRDAMERIPFVRGIARLVSGTFDFLDGAAESAQLMPQPIVKGTRFEQGFARLFRISPTSLVAAGSALAILFLLGGLMIAGPWALVKYALPLTQLELSRGAINAIACAARVLAGLICAVLIPRLRIVNRFCMYRGAINQVLNAAGEADVPLTQQSAERSSPFTGCSDAAFDIEVLLVSMILFALIRTFTLPVQLLVRALTLLCVAAVLNEPIRLLEQAGDKGWARGLLAFHRWLERRLVRKPHPQMVEVALYAYNAARENR